MLRPLMLLPSRSTSYMTIKISLALVLGLYSAGTLLAQTPEEMGREIAEEMDRRDEGFGDSYAELRMVLSNQQGERATRRLRIQTLEVPAKDLGDKALTIFEEPRDIEGTALLSFTKILEPDDQWLYLPALKRVKRISSANKSGPFVGSEFAYEDILSQEVDKYDYRWLRDESCGELICFVIERTPLYENSGYTRQVAWIDQAEYRVQRVDYYDRKNALLKTLALNDYNQFLNRYWRANDWLMENHQTGKTTRLIFANWEFRIGLDENDFDPNRLKRLR